MIKESVEANGPLSPTSYPPTLDAPPPFPHNRIFASAAEPGERPPVLKRKASAEEPLASIPSDGHRRSTPLAEV